jgi:hypothetical protein
MVVTYQVCMMAFLTIKDKNDEALICTLIFIVSVIYIVVGYEKVNDAGEYDFNASKVNITATQKALILEQWR